MIDQVPANSTPSPPLLLGRYRVTAQLGHTRLATVYAATDEHVQRPVLFHLMRKEPAGQERSRARFLTETEQMSQRSHPALLELLGSGEVGGRPFIVTEQSIGRPLSSLGLLTVEQALLYVRQLVGAVALCQGQRSSSTPDGLYHPPISSSNVFLVGEGQVKLVDSWLIPLGELQADLAHYRAPELSEGQPVCPASVVYALGLLLYELITGERPIRGSDARATALAHLSSRIPPLHQIRPNLYLPSLEGFLIRATARQPEQRFADAQILGVALDTLWRELGTTTQPLRTLRAPAMPAALLSADDQPVEPPAAPKRTTHRRATPRPNQSKSGKRQQRQLSRNLFGWLVMLSLVILVAGASYMVTSSLADQARDLPSLFHRDRFSWFTDLFESSGEIYTVNIVEGLNLRREPDANSATNIIAVVPNGAAVRKLEGPRIEGNIPWLRVRAEVNGRQIEGWMSMNYLLPRQ